MATALVIDDEAALTEMVELLLMNSGFEVHTATSGPEGLHKAISEQPDVVIVDVMMPGMDGYEVCTRLRGDPRTARAAIVVLTARGQPVDRGMALRSGADLHVSKPFQGKALVRNIQELLVRGSRVKFPLGYQIMTLRLARGAGATTVATNLALSLARGKEQLVAAADVALQGGQLLERLGISDPADNAPARSDSDWMATHLARHSSGLFVLPSRNPAPAAGQSGPELARKLLILREWFDYVVLDTPLNLGPSAPVIVGSSPLLLLLLTPDQASLRKAELGLAAIRQLAESVQIWPILNLARDNQEAFQRQVEKTLGLPVRAVLPWSPWECEEAVSNHRPVVLSHPQSSMTVAFQALAEQITQVAHASLKEGAPR